MRAGPRMFQRRVFLTAALAVCTMASGVFAAEHDGDSRMVDKIRKEIVTLPNYGVFDSLSYRVDGSKVTLMGHASRPTLKTSAEKVVSKIEGVESVDNQIEVLPNSPNDDRVRAQAYVAIYGNPTLSRYNPNRGVPQDISQWLAHGISNDPPIGNHPIHIVVQNGNITLDGVVDTEGDKNVATAQARSVAGAFQVTNNLQVTGGKGK